MKIVSIDDTNSWVAYNERATSRNDLRRRLSLADVCLSDLDGTDAPFATIRVAMNAIGTSHGNAQYQKWLMQAAQAKVFGITQGEEAGWEDYKKKFLSDSLAREKVRELFCERRVRESLFPGVEDFYKTLGIDCFYVTRTIEEVAKAYAKVLSFSGVYPDQSKKDIGVKAFIENGGAGYDRFIVKGNSDEDFEMLRFLRWCVLQGKIQDVIGIYVPKRKQDVDPRFEFQIGNGRYDGANKFLELD